MRKAGQERTKAPQGTPSPTQTRALSLTNSRHAPPRHNTYPIPHHTTLHYHTTCAPQTTRGGRTPTPTTTNTKAHSLKSGTTQHCSFRGATISKENIGQGDKRIWKRITIVKVLHKVLYPRRTEMESKKKKKKK